MPKENHPHWTRRYGIAITSFALAFGLTLLLWPIKEEGIFILFLAAVIVSTWYGGVKPGILTAALSVLAGTYIFLPPSYSLLIEDFGNFTATDRIPVNLSAHHYTERRSALCAATRGGSPRRSRKSEPSQGRFPRDGLTRPAHAACAPSSAGPGCYAQGSR